MTTQPRRQNNYELDPVSKMVLFLKTHKIKLISLLIHILLAFFFVINFLTLHFWGIRHGYILHLIPSRPLDFITIAICFVGFLIFTGILEVLKRKSKNRVKWIITCIFYSILSSLIFSWLLQLRLFSTLMLCLFALTYTAVYLLLLRPHYTKKHRELAEKALNYNGKKYKVNVMVMEYFIVAMHIFIVAGMVSSVYSSIPRYHFINEYGTEIIIHSVGDRVLISEFQILETRSGERYIVLDRDRMRISTMSSEDFSLNTERLFISGNIINSLND